jgi:hypothetical protein
MTDENQCPNCNRQITDAQLKTLWAEYCGRQKSERKASSSKQNGKKGGRPVTYMQTMYDAVPDSIESLNIKLQKENPKHVFEIKRLASQSPALTGFELVCDNIQWRCFWDGHSDFISITENGKMRPGINRINYAANRAAQRLVQDIHREKLMRMPEDNSDVVQWIEKMTGEKFEPL